MVVVPGHGHVDEVEEVGPRGGLQDALHRPLQHEAGVERGPAKVEVVPGGDLRGRQADGSGMRFVIVGL